MTQFDINAFTAEVSSIPTLAGLKKLYQSLTIVDEETGFEDKSEANPRQDIVFSEIVQRMAWEGLGEGETPSEDADYESAARDFLDRA